MDITFSSDFSAYVAIADVTFIAFIAMTLAGGLVAILAKQLIHAVLGLILCLIGVAGLYAFLGNYFIASMQILIYVGAVSISMVFAVMLARPPAEVKQKSMRLATKIALGVIVGLFTAATVGSAVFAQHWSEAAKVTKGDTPVEIGVGLLTHNVLAFELISLVLLIAIIGSVVIAKRGRGTGTSVGGEEI
ncbi:MAG: NADH-quinone oxidoreductase subunit J [Deltaproteobacteria bacterium]|nr:MAG: NADH-quinone oxidoreductase subunit J [Deltaproteobacteria bacterium]